MDKTDIENRRQLNAERNPRVTTLTEGGNKINPITGKPYDYLTADNTILAIGEISRPDYSYFKEGDMSIPKNYLFINELYRPEQDATFFNYQLALARMDVVTGKKHKKEYIHYDGVEVEKLKKRMKDGRTPLVAITDANGLDNALKWLAKERDEEACKFLFTKVNKSQIEKYKSKVEKYNLKFEGLSGEELFSYNPKDYGILSTLQKLIN